MMMMMMNTHSGGDVEVFTFTRKLVDEIVMFVTFSF